MTDQPVLSESMSKVLAVLLTAEQRGGRGFCSTETVPNLGLISGRTTAALARLGLVNIYPNQPMKTATLTPPGRERAQALAAEEAGHA